MCVTPLPCLQYLVEAGADEAFLTPLDDADVTFRFEVNHISARSFIGSLVCANPRADELDAADELAVPPSEGFEPREVDRLKRRSGSGEWLAERI